MIPQSLLFLTSGLLGFVCETYGKHQAFGRRKPTGFTLTLAAIIFLVLTGVYGAQGEPVILVPLAAASAFLLPFLIYRTWRGYQAIPEKEYPVWFGAPEDMIQGPATDGPSKEIHFQVQVTGSDRPPVILIRELSRDASLAQAFLDALMRHNRQFPGSAVAVTDTQGFPFGWQFYEVQLQGAKKNFIDPETNLSGPSLKNKMTIAAKRCHSQRPVIYRMKAR